MSQSSPEGIILGKGSKLISADLQINQEKVLIVRENADKNYSEEEVKFIISEALQSALVKVDLKQWFNQFKK
jgi:hypothetical protein